MSILESLSGEQKAAALSEDASTLVMAGAGTGKTTTLTARIAHLIADRGVPAREIVAVTFTRKAAAEIAGRVAESVGPAAEGLRIGTFHGLSSRILRRHAAQPSTRLKDSNFIIVDEEDQRRIMRAAAVDPAAHGPFSPAPSLTEAEAKSAEREWAAGLDEFVTKALRQVSLWKSWGLTDGMAADRGRDEKDEGTERFAAAYSLYQYELESRNFVDFGDLVLKVVTLFDEDAGIRSLEAGRVRHILVDEAQDANQVQIRWVRHLASVHGQVTAVGDEDQNIFGFQGGYAGAMTDMVGPGAALYPLTENRRCTREILRPANLLVDYNRRASPKSLHSSRSGAAPRVTGHPTDASEAAWTASRIRELVAAGAAPGEIAILVRASRLMRPFEEALARMGVASAVSSGSSLLEREEIRDVLAMVRLSVNPHDDVAFVRVANKPARNLGTSACEGIVSIARSAGMEIHEACLAACEGGSGITLSKTAKAGAKKLSRALAMLSEDGRWGRPTRDVIATALTEFGYEKHLEKIGDADARRASIASLYDLSENQDDPALFLQEVALLTDGDVSAGLGPSKVRIATMHSCKGLEFDHVFCPAFEQGVMPNEMAVSKEGAGRPGSLWDGPCGGGLEEERRLAHVAFTRARRTLDVSFAWRRSRRQGKVSKTDGPSFFVEECDLRYEEVDGVTTAELGKGRAAEDRAGRAGFGRG